MKHSVLGWVVSAGLLAGCGSGCDAGALAQAIASPAAAATTLVEPATPLLPTNDRFVANDNAAAVPAGKPELAQVLVEDGLKRTETRAVVNGAAAAGWVRAYQFVDATGAFSAYTYFREGGRPDRNTPAGVSEVEFPGGEMVLLSGVTVVRVDWKLRGDASNTALAAIVQGLPKVGGRRGLAPLLPTLFPKPGLEADSLRYALGPATYRAEGGILPADILGWDKSAEVGTATYTGRGGKGTLTLLLYPTPEIAGIRGRAIEQAVNEQIRQQGPASLGTVKLKRLGPLVEMTSGNWTPEQALALLASVHLNQEITFDKPVPPEFHAEIRKTYTLLQSIALFVGLGVLAALVLGTFLGGLRAGIRVLQGKPAASEPEFLTIDLSGRPAPLRPSHATEVETERR